MEPLLLLIFIIVLLMFFGKINMLSGRVTRLEQTVRRLQNSATPPAEAARPAPSAAVIPASPGVQAVSDVSIPAPSHTHEEWETLVGGRLLNRIGALALILGMAFFLKYAFDNDWLNETTRTLIGGVIGAALIGGGARFHRKGLHVFAQGLLGAGVAILYLTVYASFDFYQLVSRITAFALMSVVTLIALTLALRYDAQAISLLGWAGGFLTPFLLSTGEVNTIGLFTYITLLDVGLVIVLMRREAWALLEPLTVGATYVIYFVWSMKIDVSDYAVPAFVFLSIFWGLFTLLDLSRILNGVSSSYQLRRMVAVLNAAGYYLAVYMLMEEAYTGATAAVTLAIGMVYGGILVAIRPRTEDRVAQAHYGLSAVILLVIATAVQFSDRTTVILWSLEGLALLWYGVHARHIRLRQCAVALFALAVWLLCTTDGGLLYAPIAQFTPVLNHRALAFLVLAGATGAGGLILRRVNEEPEMGMRKMLSGGWGLLVFIWITVETNDVFRQMLDVVSLSDPEITRLENLRQLSISGGWLCYAIVLMGIGMWRRMETLRMMAMAFFGLAILKIFLYDLSFLETLFRIFSFISLGLILLLVSYLYQRYRAALMGNPASQIDE